LSASLAFHLGRVCRQDTVCPIRHHSDLLVALTTVASAVRPPDPVNVLPKEELAACKTLTVSDRTAVVLATLSSPGITLREPLMLATSTLISVICVSNFVICLVTTARWSLARLNRSLRVPITPPSLHRCCLINLCLVSAQAADCVLAIGGEEPASFLCAFHNGQCSL